MHGYQKGNGLGTVLCSVPTAVDSKKENPKSNAQTEDAIPTPRASAGNLSPIWANVNAYNPIERAVPMMLLRKKTIVAAWLPRPRPGATNNNLCFWIETNATSNIK